MHRCLTCGAALTGKPLFTLQNAPACAQNLPGADELVLDKGLDLEVRQCEFCGLVQMDCEPVSYYRDVVRASGISEMMRRLRREQYDHLIRRYHLTGKKIIEIGCGQGDSLEPLMSFAVDAYGIEHSSDLVKKAQAKGLSVWNGFPETMETQLPHAPFDAFVMFNFLEHQPRPNDLLRCIHGNLSADGVGLITVPYVFSEYSFTFHEFMRDHLSYYTEDTLRFLLERNGFTVLEQKTDEETLSVIVQKRRPADFSPLIREMQTARSSINAFMERCQRQGKRIAMWGASHQAFSVLSVIESVESIAYIMDSAGFKQGKYAPASHVPIVSPDHFYQDPVSCILIVSPDYAAEIARTAKERFGEAVETYTLRKNEVIPL
ncbi:MAG: methyltransferase domain-containing protein [Clostridia bacterium]|nr:methyltransferase domain-containing protein [Clostridia bacterium]